LNHPMFAIVRNGIFYIQIILLCSSIIAPNYFGI
jgi:hypothetical protein